MPNTKDIQFDKDPIIQAVVMGQSGVGKTWLAGTFPRPNFFDFDGKVGVLRNPDFVKKYGIVSAEYEQFSEKQRSQGFAINHNSFDDACRYFDSWMAPAKRGLFDTWVIDSGTFLIEASRSKALIVLGANKRSNTFDTAMKTGLAMMQMQDFGGERSLTEQFIRMVKDSGKNLLVNVHQREDYDDKGNLIRVQPLFTGQSVQIIQAMFKDVWHLKVQGAGSTTRRVLTAEYDGIHSSRSELGIGTITDPDYTKIIAKIRERQLASSPSPSPSTIPVAASPQGATVPAAKA